MESECMEFLIANRDCLVFSEQMHGVNDPFGKGGMFPRPVGLFAGDPGKYTIYRKGGEFSINSFRFSTVNWLEKNISIWPMGNLDALSFEFGGCIMSAFEYDGRWFSAHIHMGSNADKNREWNAFFADLGNRVTRLVMFRPDYRERAGIVGRYVGMEEYKIRVVGLISTERECFTLYLYPLDDSEKRFRLLAYKQHYAPCRTAPYTAGAYPYQLVLRSATRFVWDYFLNRIPTSPLRMADERR